jgi:hypothetical protein
MSYKRPRLVMALGSRGGYEAFETALGDSYPSIASRGAVYLVEHVYPSMDVVPRYIAKRINLKASIVEEGRELKEGFHLYPGVKDKFEQPRPIAIGKGGDEVLKFARYAEQPELHTIFTFQINKALAAGYGKDMMISVLSGSGGDGCDVLEKAKKAGTMIVVQEPRTIKTSMERMMPNNAKQTGFIDFELPTEGIGQKIKDFFGPAWV